MKPTTKMKKILFAAVLAISVACDSRSYLSVSVAAHTKLDIPLDYSDCNPPVSSAVFSVSFSKNANNFVPHLYDLTSGVEYALVRKFNGAVSFTCPAIAGHSLLLEFQNGGQKSVSVTTTISKAQ